MSQDFYKAISLNTLMPDSLPGVALFVKHHNNHVLYKAPGLPFTEKDKKRLIEHNTKVLYVYSGELSNYNRYVESNLSSFMQDKELAPKVRQEILCQVSVNYVQEIFNTPSRYLRQNVDRCKMLIQYILTDKLGTSALLETLGGLVNHNSYTYVHSVQVCSYLVFIHAQLGRFTEDELTDVAIGGLFHDYGKVYIPLEILDKPGKLEPHEMFEMKKHCSYGYELLEMLDIFSPTALRIVKHHHEKVNGKGYPDGLAGDEIGISAKIAAIADVYSALTTDRSYRKAMDMDSALEIMSNEMEGSFDVHLLSLFAAMVQSDSGLTENKQPEELIAV